jgi:hypothetical protein
MAESAAAFNAANLRRQFSFYEERKPRADLRELGASELIKVK